MYVVTSRIDVSSSRNDRDRSAGCYEFGMQRMSGIRLAGYRNTTAESTNKAVSNEAISTQSRPVDTSGRPNMAILEIVGKRRGTGT